MSATTPSSDKILRLSALPEDARAAWTLLLHKHRDRERGRGGTTPHLDVYALTAAIRSPLLNSKVSRVDIHCKLDHTLLTYAIAHGMWTAVRVLLDCEMIDVHAMGGHELHPSFWAVTRGHQSTLSTLSKRGADFRGPCGYGSPPLHRALFLLHHDIATWLLSDAGADPHSTDCKGRTPLHFAARLNLSDMAARLVVYHNADIHAEDRTKTTPLQLSRRKLRVFLKLWDDDTIQRALNSWTPVTPIASLPPAAHGAFFGATASFVWRARVLQAIKTAVRAQTSPAPTLSPTATTASSTSSTFTDLATTNKATQEAWRSSFCGVPIREFAAAIASPSCELNRYFKTPEHTRTLLTHALLSSHWDHARLLIDNPRVNVELEDGIRKGTPVMLAAWKGRLDLLAALHERGASLSTLCTCGATPLHLAITHGRIHSVNWLLAHGADPKAVDRDGETPLLAAVRAGEYDLAGDLICIHRADPNRVSYDGESATSHSMKIGLRSQMTRFLTLWVSTDLQDLVRLMTTRHPLYDVFHKADVTLLDRFQAGHDIIHFLSRIQASSSTGFKKKKTKKKKKSDSGAGAGAGAGVGVGVGAGTDSTSTPKPDHIPEHDADEGDLSVIYSLSELRPASVRAWNELLSVFDQDAFEAAINDPSCQLNRVVNSGIYRMSMLHYAFYLEIHPAVPLLVAHPRVRLSVECGGLSVAFCAGRAGDISLLKTLKSRGISLNTRCTSGFAPLHGAVQYKHAATVTWLVEEAGVDVDPMDPIRGITPLFIAANANQDNVAAFLLVRGADPHSGLHGFEPRTVASASLAKFMDAWVVPKVQKLAHAERNRALFSCRSTFEQRCAALFDLAKRVSWRQ